QKTLARVREEGEALVSRARKEIEAILDALKSTPSRAQIQSAKTQLQQLAQDLEGFTGANREAPPGQPVESVHPGQTVFVVPLGTSGTIVGSSSQDDVVEVEVGAMRVKARRRELRTVVGRESVPQIYPQPERTRSEPPANIPVSISIRGQRVEEAIPTVDKYLDDAFLAGVERVTVVHGKGTGALRKAVHDFLTGHPHVRSFRLGERNEGDAGATVVELQEK
ncbi:MAG: Smr/MutS family protein, partial [Acidimicrobiia bacterium]